MKKQKKIKFTIQFDEPTRAEKLSVFCNYCDAPAGSRCRTTWHGGREISAIHHDRVATFMNLEIVSPGSLYRIK